MSLPGWAVPATTEKDEFGGVIAAELTVSLLQWG